MGKPLQAIGLLPKPPKPVVIPAAPSVEPAKPAKPEKLVESTPLGVEARDTINSESTKVKTALRTQLLETEGGILGEELEEGKVKRRNTLLGN